MTEAISPGELDAMSACQFCSSWAKAAPRGAFGPSRAANPSRVFDGARSGCEVSASVHPDGRPRPRFGGHRGGTVLA